jgi:hypothetical protein
MNTVLARSPPTEGPTSGPAHAVDALAVGMGVYGWAHRETPNSKSNSGRRTTANVGMRKQRTLCPTGLLVMAIVTTSSYEKSLFPNGKTWSVAFEILEKKETVPRSLFHISPICSLLWGEKRVDLTVIQRSSDIVLGFLRKQQPLMSAGTIPFVVAAGGVHFCKANEESMIDLLLSFDLARNCVGSERGSILGDKIYYHPKTKISQATEKASPAASCPSITQYVDVG